MNAAGPAVSGNKPYSPNTFSLATLTTHHTHPWLKCASGEPGREKAQGR